MANKLFIIDTSCFYRIIEHRVNQLDLHGDHRGIYINASFYWANALGFFPQSRDRKNTRVIWALDSKPYWRAVVHPRYKAHRTNGYSQLYEDIKDQFQALGFRRLGFPGYEADDIAALYGCLWANRAHNTSYDQMFFCTPDSDWQGLIRSDDQRYLDIGGHTPRVRGKRQIYDWYVRKRGSRLTPTGKIRKQHLTHPVASFEQFRATDIWQWKHHFGDAGDNLLAGSDIRLIDLYLPPDNYNLALKPEAREQALKLIKVDPNREFSAVEAESVFNSLGCTPPITYVDSDAYRLAIDAQC